MVRIVIFPTMIPPSTRKPSFPAPTGFTLIELLIVISIIAILAGLAFPAVQGALGQGKKAQARNDVNQIATAIKAFQLEYGRLPASGSADTVITPQIWVQALTMSNTNNPRNIVFFEPKQAKGGKGGLSNNVYFDPWGLAYNVMLDLNYDNRIVTNLSTANQTYFTTVIVESGGPDTNMGTKADNISNVR
jgi:prepilin-type N-terminal cleavage/methylation domain-containing protein